MSGFVGALILGSATAQYFQLRSYRNLPVGDVDLASIDDGSYIGEADFGFMYAVDVLIKDHRIEQVNIRQNRDSYYAKLAEGVLRKVVLDQSPNVDTVTGATTTSKALQKAIENALSSPHKRCTARTLIFEGHGRCLISRSREEQSRRGSCAVRWSRSPLRGW